MSDNANASSSPLEEISPLAAHEARLYMNNLPWSVDNEQLTQWITSEVAIRPLEVTVVQNKKYGRSRGYAFVKINKSDMAAALKLNERHLQDRDIGVQEAAQRTEEERAQRRAEQQAKREQRKQQRQQQQAEKQSKPIKAVSSPSQPQSSPSAAAQPKPKKERQSRPKPVIKTFENATTIHFTNLSFKISVDQLRSFVEQAIGATVVDVTIPVRTGKFRAGQSLGFGFVTVPNDKIDATLALDGQSLEDRVLKVSLAHVHQPEDSNNATDNTEAAPRQQRPKRRNSRRRGPAKNGQDAANNNNNAAQAETAASPSGQQAAGSQPKRNRNRNRRTPRAGAEEGEAQ